MTLRQAEARMTANIAGTPAKAGTLVAKVVKPAIACRKANYSRDTIYNSDDKSSKAARISSSQQQ